MRLKSKKGKVVPDELNSAGVAAVPHPMTLLFLFALLVLPHFRQLVFGHRLLLLFFLLSSAFHSLLFCSLYTKVAVVV